MTQTSEEAPITARIGERPAFKPDRARRIKPQMLAWRFVAGALTSVGAGLVTIVFGARSGGIFLAFPAILAASLTLIEKKDDSAEAREDARGAVLGGIGLAGFAGVGALTFGHLGAVGALVSATAVWTAVTIGGYLILWFRSASR